MNSKPPDIKVPKKAPRIVQKEREDKLPPYAVVPSWMIRCRDVTRRRSCLAVLVAYAAHAKPDGTVWASMKRIGDIIGMHGSSVRDHVMTLRKHGLLKLKYKRGFNGMRAICVHQIMAQPPVGFTPGRTGRKNER